MKSLLNICVLFLSLFLIFIFLEIICRCFWEYNIGNLLNPPGMQTVQDSLEFSVKIKINENGLRDRKYPFKKGKDVFRIATIGDSMTFGWGLEASECYPKILERMLNQTASSKKFEVINISKFGSGPLHFVQFLEYLGLKYQPDLVIVTFFPGNDLHDDLKVPIQSGLFYSVESFLKHHFYSYFFILSKMQQLQQNIQNKTKIEKTSVLFDDEHLYRIAKKANVSLSLIKERLSKVDKEKIDIAINCYNKGNNYFLSLLEVFLANPFILQEQYTLSPAKWERAWVKSRSACRKIKDLCLKHNAQMLIILIPAAFQLNEFYLTALRKYGIVIDDSILSGSKIQDEIQNFCSSEGIPLLDLYSAFEKDTGGKYYYLEDGHWNKKGHQLAAKIIYNKLKNDGIL